MPCFEAAVGIAWSESKKNVKMKLALRGRSEWRLERQKREFIFWRSCWWVEVVVPLVVMVVLDVLVLMVDNDDVIVVAAVLPLMMMSLLKKWWWRN